MIDADAGHLREARVRVRFAVASTDRLEDLDAGIGPRRTDPLEVAAAFAIVQLAIIAGIGAWDAGNTAAYFALGTGCFAETRAISEIARPLTVRATVRALLTVQWAGLRCRVATQIGGVALAPRRVTGARPVALVARPLTVRTTSNAFDADRVIAGPRFRGRIATLVDVVARGR